MTIRCLHTERLDTEKRRADGDCRGRPWVIYGLRLTAFMNARLDAAGVENESGLRLMHIQ